ncbi:limonene-1,2-epoxide hydrolase [Hyphomonas adhaerens MHS-3]|uniref:Limonene-1,2-epoxide hydrolase n=1 Tax=Hyphomonas adhaerens MHS-3 TaxID=1280949 RepID=A0A069E367_9PROT|nr:nuclear transport factor 2 family protein [Hyphomonas adhaerens]KCZ84408.1 limonene-1,2-epoxide hydrolase [Hyphomonas adhaerens MHS-3]
MSNEQVIREFIAAWSRLDVEELVGFFAEDGIYHNMPTEPVQGHAALRKFIGTFINGWSETTWDVLTLMSAGDRVIAERLDRTVAHGKQIDLPCCGVFEMKDGKIAAWRDYFDLATYMKPLGG